MTISLRTILASGLSLALGACAVQQEAPKADPIVLDGTSWMMVIPKGSGCEVPPIIEFSATKLYGDLGCNRGNAKYTIDAENNFKLSPVATTMKACAPEYMKLEDQMKNTLNNVVKLRKDGANLVFVDKDGNDLMTMVPEKAGACD